MERKEDHPAKFTMIDALDLGLGFVLLGWFAVPLVLLRESPVLSTWPWRVSFVAGSTVILVAWQQIGLRQHEMSVPGPAALPLGRRMAIAGLLAVLAFISFSVPLTMHFWGAVDDHQVLSSDLWSSGFDAGLSRPLNVMFLWLGLQLTPDRVEGQLIVASLLCLANGVLVMAILRELLPNDRILPVAAAVMMILNRGDLSRFMIMWTTSLYWGPLCFFLLAVWLWLVSSRRRSRWLLFAACFFLGAALLGTEGLFPLAACSSLLAYRYWQDKRHGVLWLAAWVGTVALLAVRFLGFLLERGADSYQLRLTKGSQGEIDVFRALKKQLSAIFRYLDVGSGSWEFWPAGGAALVLVFLACWLSRGAFTGAKQSSRKIILFAAMGGAGAMVLGFLPFLHLQHLFRTHFLASAGEAVFYASLLCLMGASLPLRWRGIGTCTLIALSAGLTCLAALEGQKAARRMARVTFEKSVYILHQVHSLSPELAPDTVLLFILDDGIASPLGANYHMHVLTEQLLGAPSFVINGGDADTTARIGPNSIIPTQPGATGPEEYGWHQLVAFRVSYDGTTRLILELPTSLLATAPQASRLYRPLDRLRPSPFTDVRLLRPPPWSDGVPDLFDSTRGVLLGRNWGERRVSKNGRLYRELQNGAEIWVNPAGRSKVQIPLNIKPNTNDSNLEVDFTIRDEQGAMVGHKRLPRDGRVLIDLKLDPNRLQRFRFDFAAAEPGTPPPGQLKAYRPGTVERGILGRRNADISGPSTVLGSGWHPLERDEGRRIFRWATNDAQIRVGIWSTPVNTLHLVAEPETGMAEKGVTLELYSEKGEILGSACIQTFAEVSFKLARPAQPNEILRLHIRETASAPRGNPSGRNFRVFQCSLEQRVP